MNCKTNPRQSANAAASAIRQSTTVGGNRFFAGLDGIQERIAEPATTIPIASPNHQVDPAIWKASGDTRPEIASPATPNTAARIEISMATAIKRTKSFILVRE